MRGHVLSACLLALVLALALAACGDPFANAPAPEPFTPPPSYRAVWERTAACAGRPADPARFDRLRWYVTAETWDAGGHTDAGHVDGDVVTIARPYLSHPMVVGHELMHVLLDARGHPAVFARCRLTWETYDPMAPALEGAL